mgnify:CR=1 FL=1
MSVFFYSFFFLLSSVFFFIDDFKKGKYKNYFILFLSILLIIVASGRWMVGGDWTSYYELSLINGIEKLSWSPIYVLINFIAYYLKIGIFGVNLALSSLLFFSFIYMSKKLKINALFLMPLFLATIYFQLLLGYSRQSLALSFLFLFFGVYVNNKLRKSIFFFVLAVLSHLSSIVFLPMLLCLLTKSNIKIYKLKYPVLVAFFLLAVFIYFNFTYYKISFDIFVEKDRTYVSNGVFFRMIPNFLILIIFFNYRNEIIEKYPNLKFFFYYSIFIIIFFLFNITILFKYTTIIDRLNIYNVIFHMIVLNFLLDKLKKNNINLVNFFSISLHVFYFMIFGGWLLFGTYAVYWQNYKFIQ